MDKTRPIIEKIIVKNNSSNNLFLRLSIYNPRKNCYCHLKFGILATNKTYTIRNRHTRSLYCITVGIISYKDKTQYLELICKNLPITQDFEINDSYKPYIAYPSCKFMDLYADGDYYSDTDSDTNDEYCVSDYGICDTNSDDDDNECSDNSDSNSDDSDSQPLTHCITNLIGKDILLILLNISHYCKHVIGWVYLPFEQKYCYKNNYSDCVFKIKLAKSTSDESHNVIYPELMIINNIMVKKSQSNVNLVRLTVLAHNNNKPFDIIYSDILKHDDLVIDDSFVFHKSKNLIL